MLTILQIGSLLAIGEVLKERKIAKSDESRGTVPMKIWKHIGGIALSQLFNIVQNKFNSLVFKVGNRKSEGGQTKQHGLFSKIHRVLQLN